jgi:hypothetical protein
MTKGGSVRVAFSGQTIFPHRMSLSIRRFRTFLTKLCSLVRPYERRRLDVVFLFILAQGIFQVVGVMSIFPLLAINGYRLIPNFQLLYRSASGMSLMIHSLEEVYEEFQIEERTDRQGRSDAFQRVRDGIH